MSGNDFWKRIAMGAAAGLAGTMAMQVIRTANKKWLPQAQTPIVEDPGKYMLRKAEKALPAEVAKSVPDKAEAAGSKLLSMGYGMTFGGLFAALRPNTREVAGEGALLGLATWAVGYLGWLPKTRLMPPLWRQKPKQVALPIAEHVLYGIATVGGYQRLKQYLKA
jgi:hypothetical protein